MTLIRKRNGSGHWVGRVEPLPLDTRLDEDTLQCCSHFGCGKILSPVEALAGNKCINHMGVKPIDPIKVIKRDTLTLGE